MYRAPGGHIKGVSVPSEMVESIDPMCSPRAARDVRKGVEVELARADRRRPGPPNPPPPTPPHPPGSEASIPPRGGGVSTVDK